MIRDIKVTKEIIERHKYCDICGIEIDMSLGCCEAHCQICEKDLCENCIGTEKSTLVDYREAWCVNCWTIGEKYMPDIKKLEAKCKKLYDSWYKECKY